MWQKFKSKKLIIALVGVAFLAAHLAGFPVPDAFAPLVTQGVCAAVGGCAE